MQAPNDPLDAGLALARAFEAAGISYALGGALAYGIWGIPRATLDVDVNVFLDESELSTLADALRQLGIEVDLARLTNESRARGMSVVHFGSYRIDLFTPSIAFSREAERTRRAIDIEQQKVYFLSAEALAVFKRVRELCDHVRGNEQATKRHIEDCGQARPADCSISP